jgi:hypothetical protein
MTFAGPTGAIMTALSGGCDSAAELYSPLVVAVAGPGRLVTADSGNNRLRVVSY